MPTRCERCGLDVSLHGLAQHTGSRTCATRALVTRLLAAEWVAAVDATAAFCMDAGIEIRREDTAFAPDETGVYPLVAWVPSWAWALVHEAPGLRALETDRALVAIRTDPDAQAVVRVLARSRVKGVVEAYARSRIAHGGTRG